MPVIQKLHWLPVSARIIYKIAMIKKIRLTSLPEYLSVSVQPATYSRNLRSTGTDLLNVPDTKSAPTNIARRACNYAAPTVWNSLTANLRTLTIKSTSQTFAKHLKQHRFIDDFT